jgi:hypothetical protein
MEGRRETRVREGGQSRREEKALKVWRVGRESHWLWIRKIGRWDIC